jgi:hypothetical protein
VSNETPEIVLNEFGDLSRKAKRELLARGIDPETAVIEHLRTASIAIIPPADAPAPAPAPTVPAAPIDTPAPTKQPATEAPWIPSQSASRSVLPQAPSPELVVTQPVVLDDEDHPAHKKHEKHEKRKEKRKNRSNLEHEVQSDFLPVTSPVFADPETEPEAVRIADLRQVAEGSDLEPFSMATTASTGVVTSTSHALILPSLPEDTGSIVPLLPTGETLITGSIILPSTLGQLGADAQSLDTSEVDVIEDEREVAPSQDLAPVSATLAVSSYNTSTSVVTVPRKMGDRLPLILAVTAAVLAVGVVALFVAGYFLRIF